MSEKTNIEKHAIMIASLRKELQDAYKKNQVYEDEIAVLKYENDRLKRLVGQDHIDDDL